MATYVESSGNTSLCNVTTGSGCSEKEKTYIEKMKGNCVNDNKAQVKRLEAMTEKSMKPDLKTWINKRKKILTQLIANAESVSNDEF